MGELQKQSSELPVPLGHALGACRGVRPKVYPQHTVSQVEVAVALGDLILAAECGPGTDGCAASRSWSVPPK